MQKQYEDDIVNDLIDRQIREQGFDPKDYNNEQRDVILQAIDKDLVREMGDEGLFDPSLSPQHMERGLALIEYTNDVLRSAPESVGYDEENSYDGRNEGQSYGYEPRDVSRFAGSVMKRVPNASVNDIVQDDNNFAMAFAVGETEIVYDFKAGLSIDGVDMEDMSASEMAEVMSDPGVRDAVSVIMEDTGAYDAGDVPFRDDSEEDYDY